MFDTRNIRLTRCLPGLRSGDHASLPNYLSTYLATYNKSKKIFFDTAPTANNNLWIKVFIVHEDEKVILSYSCIDTYLHMYDVWHS